MFKNRVLNAKMQFGLVVSAFSLIMNPTNSPDLSTEMNWMQYRLIVIDSMTSCFRSEFSGRGELSVRQQILCRHLREWSKVASIFNCAVVYSNQITADPGNMFNPNACKFWRKEQWTRSGLHALILFFTIMPCAAFNAFLLRGMKLMCRHKF